MGGVGEKGDHLGGSDAGCAGGGYGVELGKREGGSYANYLGMAAVLARVVSVCDLVVTAIDEGSSILDLLRKQC